MISVNILIHFWSKGSTIDKWVCHSIINMSYGGGSCTSQTVYKRHVQNVITPA